jgi:phage terminase small subunit
LAVRWSDAPPKDEVILGQDEWRRLLIKLALTQREQLFALEYLANGHNATAAYRAVHPKCHSNNAAAVQGHRLLRKPKVAAFIQREQNARSARLRMDADEALEAITRHARGDIRKLFKNNRLLPISEWPEDVADCVKAIKPTRFGTAIVFYDKLKACELMAIAGGKLQQKFDRAHKFDHLLCLGAEPPVGDDE